MVIYLVRLSIWGIVFCLWHREAFEDIHYQAVCAAGNWEVDAAWLHIASLATTELTDKSLRLAAIEAVGNIRPQEAAELRIRLHQPVRTLFRGADPKGYLIPRKSSALMV